MRDTSGDVYVITSQACIDRIATRVRALVGDVELVAARTDGTWSGALAGDGICYLDPGLWRADPANGILARLAELPALRWVHTFMQGVDDPRFSAFLSHGITVTRSVGVMSPPIAQYVLAMMLRASKNMDRWTAAQARREWTPHAGVELTGLTVGIIGLGSIGAEVARLAKAFRMRVIGMRRTPRATDDVDELCDLATLCARSDFVVLAAALTADNRGMLGEPELRAMRPTAWLINVARGALIQEDMLVRALSEGWFAGACLDVFEREPLPPESPLWAMPNVVVTPHNSVGASRLVLERADDQFLTNLTRFQNQQALLNQVSAGPSV